MKKELIIFVIALFVAVGCSNEKEDVLEQTFSYNFSHNFTMDDFKNHPWMKKFGKLQITSGQEKFHEKKVFPPNIMHCYSPAENNQYRGEISFVFWTDTTGIVTLAAIYSKNLFHMKEGEEKDKIMNLMIGFVNEPCHINSQTFNPFIYKTVENSIYETIGKKRSEIIDGVNEEGTDWVPKLEYFFGFTQQEMFSALACKPEMFYVTACAEDSRQVIENFGGELDTFIDVIYPRRPKIEF